MEVELRNVKKFYRIGKNKVEAIRGISVSFSSKKLNVIMGPSGSGKTTLLNLIAGILVPDAGDVLVLGRNLKELKESERASFRLLNIGYVFQEFGLLPDLTVGENIALPMILAKKKREEIQKKIPELIKKVGLKEEHISRYPDELSGGERQRVAIARALSNDPKVLLADEPTSNLDTETGRRIVSLLAEIAKERTVIVSTHDPEILKGSEKVLRIRDGRIVGGS